MINLRDVEEIHSLLINTFGGTQGIRDLPSLQSALSRPFDTFDGKELYPTVISKKYLSLKDELTELNYLDRQAWLCRHWNCTKLDRPASGAGR